MFKFTQESEVTKLPLKDLMAIAFDPEAKKIAMVVQGRNFCRP